MKQFIRTASLITLAATLPCAAQINVVRSVLASGAAASTNGATILVATIGQPLIGAAQSSGNHGAFGFCVSASTRPAAVEAPGAAMPSNLRIEGSYPTPASGQISILFSLGQRDRIQLSIVDMLGRDVAILADGEYDTGPYTAHFNVSALPPGAYIARLKSNRTSVYTKFLVAGAR